MQIFDIFAPVFLFFAVVVGFVLITRVTVTRGSFIPELVKIRPRLPERSPKQSLGSTRVDPKGSTRIWLRPIPLVDFDPANEEHRIALCMLQLPGARMHPTLRFNFDSSRYDNAYIACLSATVAYHTSEEIRKRALSLSQRQTPTSVNRFDSQ